MISIFFAAPQWLRISLSLIYLGCIAFLSLLPPKDLPPVSLFEGADKIIHFCLYLGLSVLSCWSLHAELRNIWYYRVILFAIFWGILMEIFQGSMHIGRSFEYLDILSNSVGAITGILIFILLARLKIKMELTEGDL